MRAAPRGSLHQIQMVDVTLTRVHVDGLVATEVSPRLRLGLSRPSRKKKR